MLAPVIVFAYNRDKHLQKVLDALSKNELANESDVYLFMDGPKGETDRQKQIKMETILQKYRKGYFHNLVVKAREKNIGLARNVISGVTEVITKHGSAIVVEDDAVTSPGFLRFMNGALEYYRKDPEIWSIGGYLIPLRLPQDYAFDIIKAQRSSSYAWATWDDRWETIDWEVNSYRSFSMNLYKRFQFNKWGNDRALMLDDYMKGKINSWAIRFDYAMFISKKYNIFPTESLVQNIGHDGSGTHAVSFSVENDPYTTSISQKTNFKFSQCEVNATIRKSFYSLFKVSAIYRVKHYLRLKMESTRRKND